jgi:hypothetical protein
MAIDPLEALADAIMNAEGWRPNSVSNRNRNPGNLRSSYLQTGVDPNNYAVFHSLLDGYTALLYDLQVKCSGHSTHHLTPESTLTDLCEVYAPRADSNNPYSYSTILSWWLGIALGKPVRPVSKLVDIVGQVEPPALVEK